MEQDKNLIKQLLQIIQLKVFLLLEFWHCGGMEMRAPPRKYNDFGGFGDVRNGLAQQGTQRHDKHVRPPAGSTTIYSTRLTRRARGGLSRQSRSHRPPSLFAMLVSVYEAWGEQLVCQMRRRFIDGWSRISKQNYQKRQRNSRTNSSKIVQISSKIKSFFNILSQTDPKWPRTRFF